MRQLVLLLFCLLASIAQNAKPPASSETAKLVKEYLTKDGRNDAERTRQLAILDRLATLPELTPSQAITWQKELLKLAAKAGPKLDSKGRGWFWEKPERKGLYIVGGKTTKPKGLLIGFQGGGAGAGDAGSSHSAYTSAAAKLGWVAVFPEVLEKTEHGWTDSGTEEFVVDLIEAAKRTWKLDPDHIYFSGHSMGGYGSWTLGAHHADTIAAAAPSAGAPTPLREQPGGPIVAIVDGVIPSLRNVPLVIYQSDDDPQVPPDANRGAVEALKQAKQRWGGFDFEYWEVSGRGHAQPPGGTPALLDKIKDRARNPVPARVVWQPALGWKRQLYWLYWEKPVIGALVVADVDKAKSTITITCDKDPTGLSVLVDDRLVDMKKDIVVTIAGKEVFRGRAKRTLATLLLTAARNDAGLVFSARLP